MAIDLRSDTVTKPTQAMRAVMAAAEVGDDERDGDPTTRRLEERVAALLGKEAALFFPSGTMANQAAVWVHTTRGTEVLVDVDAHLVHSEIAGVAALSGAQVLPVHPSNVVMNAADIRAALRPVSRYFPAASLIAVENTHNGAGGKIIPLDDMRAIRAVANEHELPIHLDGARLWNASIATGISLRDLSALADTVMVAFSKGLGAPIGAALAGTRAAIERAWTARKMFGGAMRQTGMLGAACLYAIEHHMTRLAEDHANARTIASIVDGAGDATVVAPDTNIVMIDLAPGCRSAPVVAAAKACDVLVSEWSESRIRMVTHLDVSPGEAERAAEVVRDALAVAPISES
jgi:threonine aldolase